jgi:hypothetical protein
VCTLLQLQVEIEAVELLMGWAWLVPAAWQIFWSKVSSDDDRGIPCCAFFASLLHCESQRLTVVHVSVAVYNGVVNNPLLLSLPPDAHPPVSNAIRLKTMSRGFWGVISFRILCDSVKCSKHPDTATSLER